MVTVIRPSRARCVKGTIPRHERAVLTAWPPARAGRHTGHRPQWIAARTTTPGLLSRVVCFAPESGRIDGALRLIRRIVNEVLGVLDGEFGKLYAAEGRPSIAPERLLRALLLQAFYTSVRSAS